MRAKIRKITPYIRAIISDFTVALLLVAVIVHWMGHGSQDVVVITYVPRTEAVRMLVREATERGELPDCDALPKPTVGELAATVACLLER